MHVRPLTTAEIPIRRYSLFIDERGRAHDINVGGPSTPMGESAYRLYLDSLLQNIQRSGRTDLLIRIHGGRTGLDEALAASLWQRDSILRDTLTSFYPILVNWESTDPSSYGEHLTTVRQGQRYGGFIQGPLLTPLYLVADLGAGVARLPLAVGYQVKQFWWPATDAHIREKERAVRLQQAQFKAAGLVSRSGRPLGDITIDTGTFDKGSREQFGDGLRSFLYLVPKFLLTYVIESAGPEDFANMQRRTATMFRNPSEFKVEKGSGKYAAPSGAMSTFLSALDSLIRVDTSDAAGRRKHYTVTLVGHSMGAIVAGEMVRVQPSLPYKNIVFMAAASTMREFEVGVLPYLQSHESTHFYDLTLHRLTEVEEQEVADFAPRGSLLSWLDGYLTDPQTDMDRTIGRYDNVVLATHIFPDSVRGQIHIKAFGYHDSTFNYGPELKPFKHGQFLDAEMPFWRCAFWSAPGATCREGAPALAVHLRR